MSVICAKSLGNIFYVIRQSRDDHICEGTQDWVIQNNSLVVKFFCWCVYDSQRHQVWSQVCPLVSTWRGYLWQPSLWMVCTWCWSHSPWGEDAYTGDKLAHQASSWVRSAQETCGHFLCWSVIQKCMSGTLSTEDTGKQLTFIISIVLFHWNKCLGGKKQLENHPVEGWL